MKMKKIIYTLTVLFSTQFAFAQQFVPCSADYEFQKLKEQNPQVEKNWMQYNQAFLEHMKTVDLNQLKANKTTIAGKAGSTPKYIIPVVFHILHNNNAYGENVADAQANQEIANMNANYSASNMYRSRIRQIFKDVEGDPQIEFRLAKLKITYRDTLIDGLTTSWMVQTPTTGIEHLYVGPMTAKAGDQLKLNTSWDPSRYLNVWVVATIASSGGFRAGGYCNFPTGISSYKFDGPIVCVSNGFGVPPASASGSPFSLVTVTHEVGHYLGLLHPFDGSSAADSCSEDYCYDTPPVYYTPYGGSANNAHIGTCGVDVYSASANCATPYLPDQAENMMDYYIGPCASIMFTEQQVARMHFTLENYRRALWQRENLIATGVYDSVASLPATQKVIPIPAFSIASNNNLTDVRACINSAVNFMDNSYNGTITKWQWDLGDGHTSIAQNPSVTYTTSGYKTVTLTVTGANGSNTKTIENYIYIEGPTDVQPYVKAHAADWDWANTYLQDGWHFENEAPYNSWIRTTNAFYTGIASLELQSAASANGFNYSLISPPYNFTGATSAYFEFYYAFATNKSGSKAACTQDALSVHTSIDCGKTWSGARKLIGGSTYSSNAIPWQNPTDVDPNLLSTVPAAGSSSPTPVLPSLDFRPTGQSQWQKVSISGSSIPTQANVKFKITVSYGGGNNLFIDNLRLGLSSGINEISASDMKINVYPNPFSDNSILTYTMPSKAKVEVKVFDIVGKEIGTVYSGVQELGTQQIAIEKSKLNISSGLYFIKMTLDETKTFTHKIVVN